jgi:large subunit ribosomal protein L4
MNATTYTSTGTKAATTTKLNSKIFEAEIKNHELLKDAYNAYLANGRANLAVTKTRGLIRGGGKKPWKQKGTGRARFGSTRNPIWRGGGIVFGPTGNENYKFNLNVKAKRLAVRQALTVCAAAKKLVIIDDFKLKAAKTAEASKLIAKLSEKSRVLIAMASVSDDIKMATSNLQSVKVVRVNQLNVFDIMNADTLILTKDAVAGIEEWLGDK